MKVYVQIKETIVCVECGTGRNKISWLCNAAFHRLDKNSGLDLGNWSGVEDPAGAKLNPDAAIGDKLEDGSQITLKFEELKIEEEKTPKPAPAAKKK